MKAMYIACVIFCLLIPLQSHAIILPSVPKSATKIHLNQADAKVLTHSFPGIGEKRALAIVNYRQQHGNFKSVNDLANVRGIGRKFVQKNATKLQDVFIID